MKRVNWLPIVSFLFLALARVTFAADAPKSADSDFGVRPAEERVLKLPQDQKKFYLTIFGDPANRRFQLVLGWFDGNAKLNSLKKQTHFNVVTTDSAMYRSRYAASTGTVPCVRLQDGEGTVLYQASGENIPLSAESLYRSITDTESLRRRCHPNPEPQPEPQPEPTPPPDDTLEPSPDPQPYVDNDSGIPPIWILAILLTAGAAAGGGAKYYETYYGKK